MKFTKRAIVLLSIITLLTYSTETFAFYYDKDKSTEEVKDVESKVDFSNLSVEDAVLVGLRNSIDLKKVKNQIELSKVSEDRAEYLSGEIEDGSDLLERGKQTINKKEKQLNSAEKQLENAKNSLNSGIVFQDIQLPNGGEIKAGTNLNDLQLPDSMKHQIVSKLESGLDQKEEQLKNSKELLNSKKEQLDGGQLSLINSLQAAGSTLSNKLNFDSLGSFGAESTSEIMTVMANISYEVTLASYDMYKNQIAMLIKKKYFDVLKAQNILDIKKKAQDRGAKQYEFAKAGYEEGMKAKDDMLLAKTYYKKTQIEYTKAKGDLKQALIELKKVMNISLDKEVNIVDVSYDINEAPDIDKGLKMGLENRLEIKKAIGEMVVYNLNFQLAEKKYTPKTFQYKEAKLLKEKNILNYDKIQVDVESSIRESFDRLNTVREMLKNTEGMLNAVKENLEIAEYKYKEGFGVETQMLKKLDLESSAGTIVEVLAAEEKLAEVEESIVEIIHGYNLAKEKYYNDIAKYTY
ncbi:TolC family protein [Dethiothermospora halolimnae]|uniref:TolC family protein n=1 Tax=Dethiothermospora halolimnae TaxID=3114390 RepID=UPI003CCC4196